MKEAEKSPPAPARMVVLLETITVFLWFLLDGLWLMEWKVATYICSCACLSTCLLIFAVLERKRVLFWMAGADTAWLCTNILWAIADLEQETHLLLAAKLCFFGGVILFAVAFGLGRMHKELGELILRRMRILQIFSRN